LFGLDDWGVESGWAGFRAAAVGVELELGLISVDDQADEAGDDGVGAAAEVGVGDD
jgi:hypothetical protein